jgi:hypothetical protein
VSDRISCCVPYCRRTVAKGRIDPHHEWLCRNHWRLVPRVVKAKKRLADRIWDRANDRFLASYTAQGCTFTIPQYQRAIAAQALARDLWARCKREAIERAVGI